MESLNVDEATEEEMRAYGITSKNKSGKEGNQEENSRESELSKESKLDDESNESTTDGIGNVRNASAFRGSYSSHRSERDCSWVRNTDL